MVSKGKLTCKKQVPEIGEIFLKNYLPGEIFGELALLYNAPRAASIMALEDSELYSLSRDVFNHIVKQSAIKNREKYEDFLNQVEILSSMDNYERQKLTDCLEVVNYEDGDFIIREGENGDTFYLILEGEAKALKFNPNSNKNEVVMQYKEKMYFGELSLLKDIPRQASIVAIGKLKLAKIDRKSFKRILGPLESIMDRKAQGYKKF